MIKFWDKITSAFGSAEAALPSGPAGARAYGVGDIHGRIDLLDQLLDKIDEDLNRRPSRKTYLVFLGDLIDRGPESAAVVERLRTYSRAAVAPVFLSGNHEEILLRVLRAEPGVLADWLRFGGTECAQSYGVDPAALARLSEEEGAALLQRHIPASHVRFIESFGDTFRFGDYLFVHAGIRPGVALEEQSQRDLRWIRDPFLSDAKGHGFTVVHGHTIVDEVEEKTNRIGIDTGAVRSGVLTSIVIDGGSRRYLSTAATQAERARAAA